MKNSIIISLVLVCASLAHAKLVVISDIDDTIKVSHVLDRSDSIKKAFKTQNLFRGMNVLYREIARRNPGTEFYYISNAPRALMERSHHQFLTQHKFPNGVLAVRENLSITTHKEDTIRKILSNPSIKFVIFIGDNGERDPVVYAQMRKEFPTIPAITYIRQAYSMRTQSNEDIGQPLQASQLGFMTPVEISEALARIGILTTAQVAKIESEYIPTTIALASKEDHNGDNGTLSFPRWIDCRDFDIPDTLKKPGLLKNVLLKRLMKRCSIPAIED